MARRTVTDTGQINAYGQDGEGTPETGAPMNLGSDNKIDASNLQQEFLVFPSVLYSYCEAKSEAGKVYETLKQQCEEAEAEAYIRFKSGPDKVTEKHVEALIATDPVIKGLKLQLIAANRDLETTKNYVESLRAKKDMLIQLGADARKE